MTSPPKEFLALARRIFRKTGHPHLLGPTDASDQPIGVVPLGDNAWMTTGEIAGALGLVFNQPLELSSTEYVFLGIVRGTDESYVMVFGAVALSAASWLLRGSGHYLIIDEG